MTKVRTDDQTAVIVKSTMERAMGILSWIVLGLIAGWLAGLIWRRHGFGIFGDIVIGILGALFGGWIGSALLGLDVTGVNFTSIVLAVVGALILLAIYRAIVGARHEPI